MVSALVETFMGTDGVAYGRADSHWTVEEVNADSPAAAISEPPASISPIRTVEYDPGVDALMMRAWTVRDVA